MSDEPSMTLPLEERTRHRPEPVYFRENPAFPVWQVMRLTAQSVSQWATTYQAWPVGVPALLRQGPLPADRTRRNALIDDLFDWPAEWSRHQVAAMIGSLGLLLMHEEHRILDQHDGDTVDVWLTPDQFAALQNDLASAGFPRDVFYPEQAVRYVTEPYEIHGKLVRGEIPYSPLEFARRDTTTTSDRRLPTESERRRALYSACLSFADALSRRSAELKEPGAMRDQEELVELRVLQTKVDQLRRRLSHVE